MLFNLIALSIILGTAKAATGGQFCGTNLCVNAVVNGNSITYQLVSQFGFGKLGWMAVGFGTEMPNSPIVVTWPNSDGSVTVSQREASAHVMPTVVPNPTDKAIFVAENSILSADTTTIAFTYPIPSTSLNAVPMIWAYSTKQPSSSAIDATIVQHDKMGTATMDLTQNVNALATGPSATVTVIGGNTQTLLPTATGSSVPISTPAGLSDSEKTIRTHGILMSVGFLVCLPLGIFIARFSRTISYLKTRWFTAHWFVQFIVSSPIILAGWITGYHYVGESHFEDTHTRVGLALLVLYLAQMNLGVIIHFFKPKREPLPQLQSWNRGEAEMATMRPLAQPSHSSTSSNIDQTTPAPDASHVALAGPYGSQRQSFPHAEKPSARDTIVPAITARPIQNYAHAVLGLTIIGLALFNVHEGYDFEWFEQFGTQVSQVSFLRQMKAWWTASVIIIPLIYIAGLSLLPRQWRQETSARRASASG